MATERIEKAEKKDDGVAAQALKTANEAAAKVRKLGKRLEEVLGIDLDGDGTLGKFAAVFVALSLVGCMASAETVTHTIFDNSTYGTASFSGDSSTANCTLTVDDLTVSDDLTVTDDAAVGGDLTVTGTISGTPAAGAVNGSVVSAVETYGIVNKTVLTLSDVPIAVTDLTGSTNSCGGTKIYDFPAGQIYVLGFMVENFTFKTNATIDNAHGGDFAFGTTVGAGPDLTSTEIDMTDAKVSIDTITNVVDAVSAFDSVAESYWDGTATAVDLYVNVLLDGDDIDATTTNNVDATVKIHWINLGDD